MVKEPPTYMSENQYSYHNHTWTADIDGDFQDETPDVQFEVIFHRIATGWMTLISL